MVLAPRARRASAAERVLRIDRTAPQGRRDPAGKRDDDREGECEAEYTEVEAKTERLQDKIKTLREQMRRMEWIKDCLTREPDTQLSLTDRDARSMMSQAKGTGVVGYNVQTAVDAKHHLIVAHEVTNVGSDRAQLSKMALAAREAMGKTKLQAIADRGYYNAPELKACDDAGIAACVPKPMTSNAKADGRFDKSDFIYIADDAKQEDYGRERQMDYFNHCVLQAFPQKKEDAPPTMQYFLKIVDILKNMKKEDLSDKSILLGSPQKIVETLKRVEKSGIDEVILYFNVGNKPHSLVKEQMHRFMKEIAPHFQGKHIERMKVAA